MKKMNLLVWEAPIRTFPLDFLMIKPTTMQTVAMWVEVTWKGLVSCVLMMPAVVQSSIWQRMRCVGVYHRFKKMKNILSFWILGHKPLCFSLLTWPLQVIFVSECNPPNSDYMYGKQGLLKGLVPRAFLEMLDDWAECFFYILLAEILCWIWQRTKDTLTMWKDK